MKGFLKSTLLIMAFFALAFSVSAKELKFVLITMDSMDEHWLSVKAGAEAKAKELGIKLSFNAPSGKVDPNEQTRMVEDAITKRVDAILIAPSDAAALSPVVNRAIKAKIPVVVIDSPVNSKGCLTFLATDNYKAAQLAADELAKLINNKGKVAIVNAQAGSGTTVLRVNGFVDRIKTNYPDIKIVSTQYCNGDKMLALSQAMDIMTANPDLAGFYTSNEGSTVGVARAIQEKGKSRKIILVGFDKSVDIIKGIENHSIEAVMAQDPYKMGYDGVAAAYDFITSGKKPAEKVDTGVKVITIDNVSEIKKKN
ncbi:MAG: ABC transporter substrate-binding protein [Lentisphaerota bacterium]